MNTIGEIIRAKNLQLDTENPVLQGGFTQTPVFILRDPQLTAGAKVVYSMFLSYAWDNDSCFPGQDRLAVDLGMSRTSVTAFVADLQEAGLISIQRRGLGKTNIYTIHYRLARHYQRSPEQINDDELKQYLLHLLRVKKHASNTMIVTVSALRFFYHYALSRSTEALEDVLPQLSDCCWHVCPGRARNSCHRSVTMRIPQSWEDWEMSNWSSRIVSAEASVPVKVRKQRNART